MCSPPKSRKVDTRRPEVSRGRTPPFVMPASPPLQLRLLRLPLLSLVLSSLRVVSPGAGREKYENGAASRSASTGLSGGENEAIGSDYTGTTSLVMKVACSPNTCSPMSTWIAGVSPSAAAMGKIDPAAAARGTAPTTLFNDLVCPNSVGTLRDVSGEVVHGLSRAVVWRTQATCCRASVNVRGVVVAGLVKGLVASARSCERMM